MFTGGVSSFPTSTDPGLSGPTPGAFSGSGDGRGSGLLPPASAYWRARPELRADLPSSLRLIVVLALAGLPAGVLWWWLAPRADFRITADGPVVIGSPPHELLIADDALLALILAGVGLLAGVGAWLLRRRRGVATVVALTLGALGTGAVAWWLGELLGPGPTRAELADVGSRVTTALHLGSPVVLAVAPFTALLVYLFGALYTHDPGLGRETTPARDPEPPTPEPATDA
jgi:hypothetical protein